MYVSHLPLVVSPRHPSFVAYNASLDDDVMVASILAQGDTQNAWNTLDPSMFPLWYWAGEDIPYVTMTVLLDTQISDVILNNRTI